MQPDDQPQPTVPQPGTIINPGAPAPQAPPPALEPDPAPSDDPRPEVAPVLQQPASEPQMTVQPPQLAAYPVDAPMVTWQASEYVHHDKKFGWYLIFFVFVAVLIAVAVITHQWLTIGVFVVMAGALVVYANKAPRVLNYSLGDQGITIDNKLYPYNTFRSFGVIQDVAWHLIDLEPLRRFMPRLSIMIEDDRRDQIVDILAEYMPRQDRQPDLIERAARYLRF